MSNSNAELIDRVSATSGLHLPALAVRLGLKERTLKRIRAGELELTESTKLHLLDIERLATMHVPLSGNSHHRPAGAKRVNKTGEDAPDYDRKGDEALQLVLARVTGKFTVNELAALISEIADDEDLPSGLRTRVVKIISELIPQRMK